MQTQTEPSQTAPFVPSADICRTSYTLETGRVIDASSTHCPLWAIVEDGNPRTYFDDKEMAELEASVEAQGVIQPIIVRVNSKGLLAKVVGGRRYRAANKVFGEDYEMPISFRVLTDEEADALALIENHHRSNVTPTEESVYAMKLLSDFKGNRDETAKYLGWSRTVLDNRLALTALSENSMKALNERKIVLGVAELLASLSKVTQDKILPVILDKNLSVAAVKETLQKQSKELAIAIFDRTECASCPHNSDLQQGLFTETLNSGSCSKGSCYDAKTEAELVSLQDALKDTYPVVRIIRVGDNETVTRIIAEGANGVGTEQAAACRACANFGGAISALPNAMGQSFQNQCFDMACNKEKVKAYQDSLKPVIPNGESKANSKADKSIAKPVGEAKKMATPTAPATSVTESQRVKEYREKIWRSALCKELHGQPDKSIALLIALAAQGGQMSKISSTPISKAIEKITGVEASSRNNLLDHATAADSLSTEHRNLMFNGMTQGIAKSIEVSYLENMMSFMKVDLAKHWKMSDEFLKLISISEIDYIAKQIKLDVFMDGKYSALLKLKKDDFIKGILESGFNFDGVVPKIMQYKK